LIVVQATGKNVLLFKTTMGRVVNLTLRQMGGGEWYGVDIVQGRLELEGCDINSQSLACVAIHGGADPLLRRNRIHDGKAGGVYVYENGQGTLEDNAIFGNTRAGVHIQTGGNPTLRRNRINKNGYEAVWVNEGGGGTIEDNDLRDNTRGVWDVSADSEPKLKRARNQE
jgi:parallel beta-helix repeat protein